MSRLYGLMWFALALVSAMPAEGGDVTPVSEIVAAPDVFHLRQVELVGTVNGVRSVEPYLLPSGTACYGAYTFVLEDEQEAGGFIDVAVLGLCGPPVVRHPDVTDGDRIRLHAEIQVPSRFGEFRDTTVTPVFAHVPPVHAIARSITREDSDPPCRVEGC